MAELTVLEEKLSEVLGLAQAAQDATQKVEGLVDDEQITAALQQMREEAAETELSGAFERGLSRASLLGAVVWGMAGGPLRAA
ncbi:MAG TPA: hypothetical protein VFY04_03030 [Solirubrobacterales bacterium]|nr:hypothetical protein [Solirubrobacterales bacterium]